MIFFWPFQYLNSIYFLALYYFDFSGYSATSSVKIHQVVSKQDVCEPLQYLAVNKLYFTWPTRDRRQKNGNQKRLMKLAIISDNTKKEKNLPLIHSLKTKTKTRCDILNPCLFCFVLFAFLQGSFSVASSCASYRRKKSKECQIWRQKDKDLSLLFGSSVVLLA